MSSGQNQVLIKLQQYAEKIEKTEYHTESSNGDEPYEMRINKALQQLQEQVKQHQDAFERLQVSSSISPTEGPSQDPASRVRQLQIITAAYKSLTVAPPILPSADSPLPPLLALRSTQKLIHETQTLILATKEKTAEARTQLRQEYEDLYDAQLISNAVTLRIERIRSEQASSSRVSSTELVEGMILDEQTKKRHYVKDLRNLVKCFNKFVDGHLAGMLAVDEFGGPVVGDMMEVDEEVLKTGFSQQGKSKKPRKESAGNVIERKRRIDDIWGPTNEGDGTEAGQRSEKEAAGAAFRALTEDLLNAAAGDENSDPWLNFIRKMLGSYVS